MVLFALPSVPLLPQPVPFQPVARIDKLACPLPECASMTVNPYNSINDVKKPAEDQDLVRSG
jgi:hypothetical protein